MTDKKLILEKNFEIRWVDMDAYKHLNNAKIYDLMTECRVISFWKFNNDCNFIVTENSCKYKKPVQYPAMLSVSQYVQNISAAAFECLYIFKNDNQEVAEGYAKMVCFDPVKNRLCKIPEALKIFFKNC